MKCAAYGEKSIDWAMAQPSKREELFRFAPRTERESPSIYLIIKHKCCKKFSKICIGDTVSTISKRRIFTKYHLDDTAIMRIINDLICLASVISFI